MSVYETKALRDYLAGNPYVGRGIVIGKTQDGKKAVSAYFIMGRSANSRNRIFVPEGKNIMIKPFDESKVEDPSLIIYYPVREYENHLIVTNGDQTDTIWEFLKEGGSFEGALRTRKFEPDGPNWTPRISGMLNFGEGDFCYQLSILKSADPEGTANVREFFEYDAVSGLGHILHTYNTDGNPLPTYTGEPSRVIIPDDIEYLTRDIWENLNEENKISLYVRYTDLATGDIEERLINKFE